MLNNKIDAPREALGVSTPGLTRAVSVSVGVPERDCGAGKQPGWLDRHARGWTCAIARDVQVRALLRDGGA